MGYATYIESLYYTDFCENDIEEVALQFEEPDVLQQRLDILDETFEEVLSLCSDCEFYVVHLLLSGFKKIDISKALNIPLSQIKKIQSMFISVFASMLSQKFERQVDELQVKKYLNDLKVEKHRLDRIWEQWTNYRKETEQYKREKEKQALLKEIEKHKKGGM